MKNKIVLFSVLSLLLLAGCGSTPSSSSAPSSSSSIESSSSEVSSSESSVEESSSEVSSSESSSQEASSETSSEETSTQPHAAHISLDTTTLDDYGIKDGNEIGKNLEDFTTALNSMAGFDAVSSVEAEKVFANELRGVDDYVYVGTTIRVGSSRSKGTLTINFSESVRKLCFCACSYFKVIPPNEGTKNSELIVNIDANAKMNYTITTENNVTKEETVEMTYDAELRRVNPVDVIDGIDDDRITSITFTNVGESNFRFFLLDFDLYY